MKAVLKISIVLSLIALAAYFISFYVMPSVTVKNKSNTRIQAAKVTLPNAGLDFGPIEAKEQNTIHYSLEQTNGVYKYHFVLKKVLYFKESVGTLQVMKYISALKFW